MKVLYVDVIKGYAKVILNSYTGTSGYVKLDPEKLSAHTYC